MLPCRLVVACSGCLPRPPVDMPSPWHITPVKCRGKPAGYRAYIVGTYHSYHKTQALAKAAIEETMQVNKGLGSTPRPESKAKGLGSKAKGLGSKAKGLGSIPRPKAKAKADAKAKAKRGHVKNTKAGLGSTPRPQAVMFKGIVPKFSVRKGRWIYRGVVRQPGTDTKLYVGTSDDQKDLARRIARATGHEKAERVKRRKCDRRPATETMRRFRIVVAMFKGWRPRDLTGAVKRRGQAATMIVQGPGVYVAFLMGREHSWRDAALKIWGATDSAQKLSIAGLDSNDEDLRLAGSKALHGILCEVFREWARETSKDPQERADWREHVDRNVQYHLSLAAWGLREGLLVKSSRARSLGVQNKRGEWYGLCAYSKSSHHERMLRMHRMGRMLLLTPVPRTNQEWSESIEGFGERCAQAGINTGQKEDNYHFWFLARLYLIVEMRHRGIEQLRVTADWDKDQVVAAMVPDMCDWLSSWMSSPGAGSLKSLLSKLSYREPLEMLSCFCCILGDNEVEAHSTDALASAGDAIGEQRRIMRATSARQDEGHPALIIREALAQGDV